MDVQIYFRAANDETIYGLVERAAQYSSGPPTQHTRGVNGAWVKRNMEVVEWGVRASLGGWGGQVGWWHGGGRIGSGVVVGLRRGASFGM